MKKIDMHRFSGNIGLKIIAFIFATVLWLTVGNMNDPIDTEAYKDIPLTLKNQEIITNDGKRFKIMDEVETVRVVVRAQRSILRKIDSRDITAVVDLRQRDTDTGMVPITAVVAGYEDSLKVTTETNPNKLLIRVENEATKIFPISVQTEGTQRDGYEIGEMKVNPERVEISGTESTIEDIQKVVAKIDINGIYKDDEIQASDMLIYDGNGNVMDKSGLRTNLGDKGVSVDVQVLPSKGVKLNFNVSGIPASGYRYTGMNYVPEEVEVYGKREILEELDAIDVPAEALDITDVDSKVEYTIDIASYLPEGVRLKDETASNVVVTVMVEKEGTRTLLLSAGAIRINNLHEDLSAAIETTGVMEVQFTGEEAVLEKLDIKNAASIDLRDYTEPGTYEVPVNIEVDTEAVLTEKPVVVVKLTKQETEDEPAEGTE